MKRKWRIILGFAFAVLIISLAIVYNAKGLEADLLEIKPDTIAKTFEEDGEVIAEVEREIYAPFNGRIENLLVVEGQEVKLGDLLVQIDDTELKLQLEGLKSQLAAGSLNELAVEQARIQLEMMEQDFERINLLYDEGVATEKELELAKNQLAEAQSNLQQQQNYSSGSMEALESQINLLQKQIGRSNISSPIDGKVSNLAVKAEQAVSAAIPLMTIFEDKAYKIEVYVLTDELDYVKPGEEVELILGRDEGDQHFTGKVIDIAPAAIDAISPLGLAEKRVKVTILPTMTEKIGLRPGYKVKSTFTANKLENKLIVPKTVLFPFGDGVALWVVREGKALIQPVQTGFDNGKSLVVDEGIGEGDLVILNPQLKGLKEGKKVTSN